MVNEGDKLLILEDAYSTFSETKQKTYWNCKVELPDGSHKLAGLMEMVCEEFAKKWGSMTEKWTGHTIQVALKTSKSGVKYMTFIPTDDPIVDIEAKRVEQYKKDVEVQQSKNEESGNGNTIEYPKEEIDPNDIPF